MCLQIGEKFNLFTDTAHGKTTKIYLILKPIHACLIFSHPFSTRVEPWCRSFNGLQWETFCGVQLIRCHVAGPVVLLTSGHCFTILHQHNNNLTSGTQWRQQGHQRLLPQQPQKSIKHFSNNTLRSSRRGSWFWKVPALHHKRATGNDQRLADKNNDSLQDFQ